VIRPPGSAPAAPTRPRLRGVSHRYARGAAIVAAVAVVVAAPPGVARLGAFVYGITLVGMFAASASYHAHEWTPQQAARRLHVDHTAIFLFIAGTATPILLLASSGALRVLVLALVWAVAGAGVTFEWLPVQPPRGYVTAVYLLLGWIGVLAVGDLWDATGAVGVTLVTLGGILYTVGAVVHAARRPDPWPTVFGYHEIFHALVIAAALLQYCAIAFVVLPLGS
jgi:hemolysin III